MKNEGQINAQIGHEVMMLMGIVAIPVQISSKKKSLKPVGYMNALIARECKLRISV